LPERGCAQECAASTRIPEFLAVVVLRAYGVAMVSHSTETAVPFGSHGGLNFTRRCGSQPSVNRRSRPFHEFPCPDPATTPPPHEALPNVFFFFSTPSPKPLAPLVSLPRSIFSLARTSAAGARAAHQHCHTTLHSRPFHWGPPATLRICPRILSNPADPTNFDACNCVSNTPTIYNTAASDFHLPSSRMAGSGHPAA
jgi:hypothetical protein